jgi:cytochrome c oxidase assembly factor CtaG
MTALAPVLLAALLYAAGVRRARRWPPGRTVAFACGLLALAAAVLLPDERLPLHMVQHEGLALVAAPLLAAGAPVSLALRSLPRGGRRALAGLIHRPAARALAHPLTGLVLFSAALLTAHVPAVYDLTERTPALHALEHAALLWGGLALWAPLVAADPLPGRPGPIAQLAVLLAAMTVMGALGAWLAALQHPVYTGATVAEQRTAGWLGGMGAAFVVMPTLLGVVWRALTREERRQRAREAAA